MKKVVFLLIGEIKFDGRVQKEIKTLKENGFDVELIVNKFYNDDFKNYNFKIHAISIEREEKSVPNTIGKFRFCKRAFEILKRIQPDAVHCNDLCTLYGGYLYKKHNRNCKLVYDAHELYPEMFSKRVLTKFWSVIERNCLKLVDEVICPEENRARYMKKKYRLKKDINIIENLPLKINLDNVEKNIIEEKIPNSKTKRKVLYLGAIIPDRNIEEMIEAFKYLSDKYCLIIIGKVLNKIYLDKLENIINENQLNNKVYLLGPVPNKEVINHINSSDIGFVFYDNNNINNYYCASNKIYEFIVCKKPIVTNNYPGLIKLIEKNKFGICLEDVNGINIYNAILMLKDIDDSDVLYKYFWENNSSKLCNIY